MTPTGTNSPVGIKQEQIHLGHLIPAHKRVPVQQRGAKHKYKCSTIVHTLVTISHIGH